MTGSMLAAGGGEVLNPLFLYRLAHWFSQKHIRFLPGLLTRVNYFLTNCDISPGARIGNHVRFQHYGCGVIIHANCEIGNDVWFNPHVVLGQNIDLDNPALGKGVRIKIGNNVMLGAGAKVIANGHLEVGDGAAIGANAVVLQSVPAGYLAIGVPARIIAHTRGAGPKRP